MAGFDKIIRWHCFFEQSGTFKNEFKKLGLDALDYDILDDYGQTDIKTDIFEQIEFAFSGQDSIFENVRGGKLFLHFFPVSGFRHNL